MCLQYKTNPLKGPWNRFCISHLVSLQLHLKVLWMLSAELCLPQRPSYRGCPSHRATWTDTRWGEEMADMLVNVLVWQAQVLEPRGWKQSDKAAGRQRTFNTHLFHPTPYWLESTLFPCVPGEVLEDPGGQWEGRPEGGGVHKRKPNQTGGIEAWLWLPCWDSGLQLCRIRAAQRAHPGPHQESPYVVI